MAESDKFSDIIPYNDEEAVAALAKVATNPAIPKISQYFYPEKPAGFLAHQIRKVRSIEEFQTLVVAKIVERVLEKSARNFTYEGVENIPVGKTFLAMSNHRDIILDPAITQVVLFRNNIPMTEICVGSNLITNKFIEDLIRSNRMVKVVRGISARELYLSSQLLSEYIRQTITSGSHSIWLAQRQGRTKNGLDATEQGLLKMLDMSGKGTFEENFQALNIIPLSISYQYESCDILKARETYISRRQKYVKGPNEDLNSIITGITQQKGNVHLYIGTPLTAKEIHNAGQCGKNDRYLVLRHAVNKRVIAGYHLWDTNYISYDILENGEEYAHMYTPEQKEAFIEYMQIQMDSVENEIDRKELADIFLRIYANPVYAKKRIEAGVFVEGIE